MEHLYNGILSNVKEQTVEIAIPNWQLHWISKSLRSAGRNEQASKDYILHDFIFMTFSKRQNCGLEEQIGRLWVVGSCNYKGIDSINEFVG